MRHLGEGRVSDWAVSADGQWAEGEDEEVHEAPHDDGRGGGGLDNNIESKLPAKGIFLDLNQVNATKVPPPGRVLIETQDLVPLFILVVQVQVVSLLRLWNLS